MKTAPIVVISGNIGVGKTSLAIRLASHLSWSLVEESVRDNPYLHDYYSDMKRWALPLQLHFLAEGTRGQREVLRANRPSILDRCVYEDRAVFGRVQHEEGLLSDRDLRTYDALFDLLTDNLRRPDLIVFMSAPVDVLLERIRRRNLGFDATVDRSYLEHIDRCYRIWLAEWTYSPVVEVDAVRLDPETRPEDLALISGKVLASLEGRPA
jgi:deoxyadenosine/deoxycytidine kinase